MSAEESALRHYYGAAISQDFRKEVVERRERAFLGTSFLLFVASAAGTIYWCGSMAGGMAMPGGWTMSLAWMKMPGQSWLGMAASFMGMWIVMMVAMMLPSLVPALSAYRQQVRDNDEIRLGRLSVLVAGGYFFVWAIFGVGAYGLGVGLTAFEMRWAATARFVPIATGIALLLAGCVQLTKWKARQLRRCLEAPACRYSLPLDAWSAWEHGFRLGLHCSLCCLGFMMILLVTGVMDLGAMGMIAVAITVERVIPRPEGAARAIGFVTVAMAIVVIARATAHLR